MGIDIYDIENFVVSSRNKLYYRLHRKDDPQARKIFVIGHSKTGTTTLHEIFRKNGLRSSHSSGSWKTADFDCFSDRGNYQPFEAMDAYYQNAVFVLSTRTLHSYLYSISKRKSRVFDESFFVNAALRRNHFFMRVAKHFLNKDNLLVMNIQRPDAFAFACEKLGLENIEGVWRNKSKKPDVEQNIRNIDAALKRLGIEDERDQPFIVEKLLREKNKAIYRQFMQKQQSNIFI